MRYLAIFLSVLMFGFAVEAAEADMSAAKKLISAGNETALNSLVGKGFDVNSRDEEGNTILYYAMQESAPLGILRILIDNGADVNAPSAQNGMTPLIIAISKAEEIQKQTALLYEQQGTVNNEEKLKEFITEQLKYALAAVKLLVEKGADVNQETPQGTPLMSAAANAWNYDIVDFLLESGADVNQQDRNGRTALFYASANDCNKIITRLMTAGANISIRDYNNMSYMEVNTPDLLKNVN